jgi:hypothetical protein
MNPEYKSETSSSTPQLTQLFWTSFSIRNGIRFADLAGVNGKAKLAQQKLLSCLKTSVLLLFRDESSELVYQTLRLESSVVCLSEWRCQWAESETPSLCSLRCFTIEIASPVHSRRYVSIYPSAYPPIQLSI